MLKLAVPIPEFLNHNLQHAMGLDTPGPGYRPTTSWDTPGLRNTPICKRQKSDRTFRARRARRREGAGGDPTQKRDLVPGE